MMRSLLPLLLLPLFFCTSCSQPYDFTGKWKNGNGETLALEADSSAVLGMEGADGGIKGRFSVSGDTVKVTTSPEVDEYGKYHNIYALVYVEPRMQLVSVTLDRDGDYETIYIEELARRLRKPADQYHFSRVME